MTRPLSHKLTSQLLDHLQVEPTRPTLPLLEKLVNAYIRTVPWESAFRIAKRAKTAVTADCPRWPDEFWQDSLERGGGGTCYESNYAFFSFLLTLGFQGYLTINNMGDSIGCHTASVIVINGQKWLTDVGIPLFAPLPISSNGVMYRATKFLRFAVHPDGENVYQIERWPTPRTNVFTLIDRPVTDEEYRAATTNDYGENGLFLDKVIVNKIIDEQSWRFNSAEEPWVINHFEAGVRTDKIFEGDAATAVSQHFSIDETAVRLALNTVHPD